MPTIEHNDIKYEILDCGLVSRFKHSTLRCGDEPPGYVHDDEVQRCIGWLKKYARSRKTINLRLGSYGLKHMVETDPEFGGYVSNGALIMAVYKLGYEIIPDHPRSFNARFKLSFDIDRKA